MIGKNIYEIIKENPYFDIVGHKIETNKNPELWCRDIGKSNILEEMNIFLAMKTPTSDIEELNTSIENLKKYISKAENTIQIVLKKENQFKILNNALYFGSLIYEELILKGQLELEIEDIFDDDYLNRIKGKVVGINPSGIAGVYDIISIDPYFGYRETTLEFFPHSKIIEDILKEKQPKYEAIPLNDIKK
ncbi:MAG: hypothetical protein J7J93_03630 [Candidatus Aenigmarchaeota archaeon]|nr:hypothetical protein [Candidatus Aenigmarchaeota archaeon]